MSLPPFVCPACRGPLVHEADYRCEPCARTYPVVAGVVDFRLQPDPYIGLDEDRAKARHLADAAQGKSFEQLVRYYYSITPDDPPDLAEVWTAHHLVEVEIGRRLLDASGLARGRGRLLDLGCSTGGLVIAATRGGWQAVGVDLALRWLIVGAHRMREAGLTPTLVCANAEHLPFEDGAFDAVTGNDLLEHTAGMAPVLREARRVTSTSAVCVFTANNRFAPLPEPQVRLWGVTQMPRRFQGAYVRWRRGDLHPYRLLVPSARELGRVLRAAGFSGARVEPAPLFAPHWTPGLGTQVLKAYNVIRRWPLVRQVCLAMGPRLLASNRP